MLVPASEWTCVSPALHCRTVRPLHDPWGLSFLTTEVGLRSPVAVLFAAFRYGLAAVAYPVSVVATVVGILVLGESITLSTAGGLLLVFARLALSNAGPSARSSATCAADAVAVPIL
jgi:hypothetical protein